MKYFLFVISFFFSLNLFAGTNPEVMKKRMLSDLDFIKGVFEVKYAPSLWKKEHAQWEVDKAYAEAKAKVMALRTPTIKDYQIILKEFFQSPRDYHVGILFYSSESATLPFMVRGADHKYFVVHTDEDEISPTILAVGDEIIKFGGQPIDQVIENLKKKEIGINTKETDQALAELMLTERTGAYGHIVPKGDVIVEVKRKNGDQAAIPLTWHYHREKIPEMGKSKPSVTCQTFLDTKEERPSTRDFFNKMMIAANFNKDKIACGEENNHDVGAKQSFIPILGRKIWENDSEKFNYAYVFEVTDPKVLPEGKTSIRIGYVRISHYMADSEEAEEFEKLMAFFQAKTEGLVIDQVNNPGGSIFYLYALASMLTDKPMSAPKHRIAMTQEEIQLAVMLLSELEDVTDTETARLAFGETIGGYAVDYHFVEATRAFCRFLINEWEEGRVYTNPTHIFGVDHIKPNPGSKFTKPVLVLINSLDFSAADFFPAILQDNKRATLLGTRTAGAGGYVLGTRYPNLIGVAAFQLTGSHALRENQSPIENLGVTPDIFYDLSEKDFKDNYKSYVETIVKNICSMCQK